LLMAIRMLGLNFWAVADEAGPHIRAAAGELTTNSPLDLLH
jgi:hypothetical protein